MLSIEVGTNFSNLRDDQGIIVDKLVSPLFDLMNMESVVVTGTVVSCYQLLDDRDVDASEQLADIEHLPLSSVTLSDFFVFCNTGSNFGIRQDFKLGFGQLRQ